MSWYDEAVIRTKAAKLLQAQEVEAEQLYQEEVEIARDAAGLRNITVLQAETWIDNQFVGVATIAGLILVLKTILKKMIPFILR